MFLNVRKKINKNIFISIFASLIFFIAPIYSFASTGTSSVVFVGDIMLGRHVETLMNTYGDEYPFAHIDPFLHQEGSTVIANLEGPITSPHVQTPSMVMRFSFDPHVTLLLPLHNIHTVTLANNHAYDHGITGYWQTTQFLHASGVDYFGNPYTYGPDTLLRKTINNQKFIFIGFNITNPAFNVQKALAYVKTIPHASDEFLVAFNHGGDEYSLHSNTLQETFYRGLVDVGVQLVIASHPHVVQEVEVYKNRLIVYSLGNFIFDQYFSHDVEQGLAIQLSFSTTSSQFHIPFALPELSYTLVPLKSIRSQPEVMNDHDKNMFLSSLASRSGPSLQSQIMKGEIDLTE